VNQVEIGSVVVSDVVTGRWMIDWSATGLDDRTVRRDVEVLSDRRFRLTTEIVPTDFPPAPYPSADRGSRRRVRACRVGVVDGRHQRR
jgi:hypothetical protein